MLPPRRTARIAASRPPGPKRARTRVARPAEPRAPDEDAERQLTARFPWLDPKDLQQRSGAAGDRLRQLAG